MDRIPAASAGNRTPIDCLEGNHANHYTTDAGIHTHHQLLKNARKSGKSPCMYVRVYVIFYIRMFCHHQFLTARVKPYFHQPCNKCFMHKKMSTTHVHFHACGPSFIQSYQYNIPYKSRNYQKQHDTSLHTLYKELLQWLLFILYHCSVRKTQQA